MSDGIFLLQGDELVEMRQQPYDSENVLQTLLAKYPNLLAGEQTSSGSVCSLAHRLRKSERSRSAGQ